MYAFVDRQMHTFEIDILLRLTKEKIENLNRPITRDWINEKHPHKEKPMLRSVHIWWFYQIYQMQILHKLLQNKEEEEMLLSSSFEDGIILLPKPYKDITRKLQTSILYEYRYKKSSTKY